MDAAERSDINDAPMCGLQMGMGSLRGEERSAGVGFKHGIPLLDRDSFQDLGFKAARIVDEEVETSEIGGDLGDGGLNAFGLAQVGMDGGGADAEVFEFA